MLIAEPLPRWEYRSTEKNEVSSKIVASRIVRTRHAFVQNVRRTDLEIGILRENVRTWIPSRDERDANRAEDSPAESEMLITQ